MGCWGHLSFVKPAVRQVRNPHDYLDDYLDEDALYSRTSELLALLAGWSSSAPLVGRIVELAQVLARGEM